MEWKEENEEKSPILVGKRFTVHKDVSVSRWRRNFLPLNNQSDDRHERLSTEKK